MFKQDEIIGQNEVLEMAKQAGIPTGFRFVGGEVVECLTFEVEAFAELVAAAAASKAVEREREACAKVCETRLGPTATDFYGKPYAEAIRARGEPTSRGEA